MGLDIYIYLMEETEEKIIPHNFKLTYLGSLRNTWNYFSVLDNYSDNSLNGCTWMDISDSNLYELLKDKEIPTEERKIIKEVFKELNIKNNNNKTYMIGASY